MRSVARGARLGCPESTVDVVGRAGPAPPAGAERAGDRRIGRHLATAGRRGRAVGWRLRIAPHRGDAVGPRRVRAAADRGPHPARAPAAPAGVGRARDAEPAGGRPRRGRRHRVHLGGPHAARPAHGRAPVPGGAGARLCLPPPAGHARGGRPAPPRAEAPGPAGIPGHGRDAGRAARHRAVHRQRFRGRAVRLVRKVGLPDPCSSTACGTATSSPTSTWPGRPSGGRSSATAWPTTSASGRTSGTGSAGAGSADSAGTSSRSPTTRSPSSRRPRAGNCVSSTIWRRTAPMFGVIAARSL